MKRNLITISAIPALLLFLTGCSGLSGGTEIGRLETGTRAVAVPGENDGWGIVVEDAGLASIVQPEPVELEFYGQDGSVQHFSAPYAAVERTGEGVLAKASVDGPAGGSFHVEDQWGIEGGVLNFHRSLRVAGNAPGGFLSAVTLVTVGAVPREEADYFVPGMIYGSPGKPHEVGYWRFGHVHRRVGRGDHSGGPHSHSDVWRAL